MPIVKNILPIFRNSVQLIWRTVMVIGIFFIILNLFSYFSADKSQSLGPTLQERLQTQREELYRSVRDPKYNNPQGQLGIAIYRHAMCSFSGELCTDNMKDGDKNFPHSLLGMASGLIIAPYVNPPASGVYYAFDSLQHAGFVPHSAYAAEGIGFASIKSLLNIWKKFRDLAYLILVLVIVAIGFMIMFRMKLNPQTVISIESALPKIVITLILITFSFAIAGFLIDLMYFVIAISISTIGNIGNLNVAQLQAKYLQAGPDDITAMISGNTGLGFIAFRNIFWHLPNAILSLISWINIGTRVVGSGIASFVILPWLNKLILDHIANAAPSIGGQAGGGLIAEAFGHLHFDQLLKSLLAFLITPLGAVISIVIMFSVGIPFIIGLVIFLSVIMLFFRILFMLFSSYIKILLLIILSPLIILFEAIPGKSAFSAWFKNLLGELLTFPLLIGIFLVGLLILETSSSGNLIKFPFFYGIDSRSFTIVVGMAILFMIPDLIMVAKKLLLPQPLPLPEAGLGVFFGGAAGGLSSGLSKISNVGSLAYYIKPIGDIISGLGLGNLIDLHQGGGRQGPPPGHSEA